MSGAAQAAAGVLLVVGAFALLAGICWLWVWWFWGRLFKALEQLWPR